MSVVALLLVVMVLWMWALVIKGGAQTNLSESYWREVNRIENSDMPEEDKKEILRKMEEFYKGLYDPFRR